MDKYQVAELIKKYAEIQFPKICPCCGVVFNSFVDYLRNTTHLGDPVSYDADLGDYQPKDPIGAGFFANCRCGTTLAITSENMSHETQRRILLWASTECLNRGIGMKELLRNTREDIDRMALNECEND